MIKAWDYLAVCWRFWTGGARYTVMHGPLVRAYDLRDAAIHVATVMAFGLVRRRSGAFIHLRRRNVYRTRVMLKLITQALERRLRKHDHAKSV